MNTPTPRKEPRRRTSSDACGINVTRNDGVRSADLPCILASLFTNPIPASCSNCDANLCSGGCCYKINNCFRWLLQYLKLVKCGGDMIRYIR